MSPRWEMTYLGHDLFLAECALCPWTHTGTHSPAYNAAIKHVRDTHL